MATVPEPGYDNVVRKVVLGLELVDLLSGAPVTKGLKVNAEGLGAPRRVTAAAFVWLLNGEPKAQNLIVKVVSTDSRFRDRTLKIKLPANDGDAKPNQLGRRRLLRPTGLNLPPPGLTAIAGMLVDDNDPPGPIADARIRIQLRDLGTQTMTGGYTAVSDARGAFVAAAPNFHKAVPTPAPTPAPEGSVVGWLEISQGGVTHYTAPLGLRPGRLLRLAAPLQLSTLSQAPPS